MRGPVFGSNQSFAEHYPQVADARVEVRRGSLGRPDGPAEVYTYPSIPGQLLCHDEGCNDGTYYLQRVFDAMVGAGQTEAEDSLSCTGHENMGHRQTRMCMGRCRVKVTLVYREAGVED